MGRFVCSQKLGHEHSVARWSILCRLQERFASDRYLKLIAFVNSLPIIIRELLLQSRRPATIRARWIAVLVVLAIAVMMMVSGGYASQQQRAKFIFIFIGILSLGAAMLAGVFQTADALSEERREGTLGLLFLTDLRGYDVVFGKLISTSLLSFYTFLSIMPVLALPLMMGGLTVGEFWRVMLAIVVTMYFSLAVGMFVSALNHDARRAMVTTFLIMVFLGGLFPFLWTFSFVGLRGSGWRFFEYFSPPFAFQQAFDIFYSAGRGQRDFWRGIYAMFFCGTAGLAAACWLAGKVWQETGGRERRRANSGSAKKFHSRTAAVLTENPFLWLATREVRLTRLVFGLFALLLPLWGFLYYRLLDEGRFNGAFLAPLLLITFGMHIIFKCVLTVEVTRRFCEDRQSGALELLLATPLTVLEIIAGQKKAIWQLFRGGFVFLTLLNLAILYFVKTSSDFSRDSEGAGIFCLMLIGGIFVLWLDGFTLIRVGMWQALIKPRQARAFFATLLRALLPPWLSMVGIFFLALMGAIRGGGAETVAAFVTLWFVIGIVTDIVAMATLKNRLEDEFREIVSVGPPRSAGPNTNVAPS